MRRFLVVFGMLISSGILGLAVVFLSFTKIDHFSKEKLMESLIDNQLATFNFEGIDEIVSSPLHYIGNGAEAIAFATADDKYVLKFFLKKQVLKDSFFKPKKKIKQLFFKDSEIKSGPSTLKKYEDAFYFLPEETGLLAIHAHKTLENLPICTLIDYRGKEHRVDLNEVAFVVQKKGKIIKRHMCSEEFERVDRQLRDLFIKISSKGFASSSRTFNPANYAIFNNQAIMIDLGKLEYSGETSSKLEEEKLKSRYLIWLKRKLIIKS